MERITERAIAIARPAERTKRLFFSRKDPWLTVLSTVIGCFFGFWLTAGFVPALWFTAAVAGISVLLIGLWERKCGT